MFLAYVDMYLQEQFCQDWDNIPLNPDAGRICDEPVAGNYGPPMNVWHIGLVSAPKS